MHFRPITYIDTLVMTGGLAKRRDDFTGSFDGAAKVLELRRLENGEIQNAGILKEWLAAGNVLKKVQRALAADLIGLAYIEMLPPRTTLDWRTDTGEYFDKHDRFHLPLFTNPFALMYAGIQQVHLPVGALWWTDIKVPHCAVNLQEHPRYHLVVDVRKADA